MTDLALELVPKRLELMKEVMPGLKRVALLCSPLHAGEQRELDAVNRGAASLGLTTAYYPVTTAVEIEAAFENLQRQRSDAILAFADALIMGYAEKIATLAVRTRIPAVSGWAIFAEKGNLMTYGPVLENSYYRLASFADRILKGAKAGEIPVEFPTAVEFVVNRKAAQALKVNLPPAVLARATRIID